ncbi:hypothetical protein [Bacteroides finegoldii]|jgi:hypothetical protein|nr:hypothetical protein [Bacteroides finegoldii]
MLRELPDILFANISFADLLFAIVSLHERSFCLFLSSVEGKIL